MIVRFSVLSQYVRNVSIPFPNSRFWHISGAHSVRTCKLDSAQTRGLGSEGESYSRRMQRIEGENEEATQHFILNPFLKLIGLFTLCGSSQVVRLQKSKTLYSSEFT